MTLTYILQPLSVSKVEYPRHTLEAWKRIEEGRSSDRGFDVRLRILFAASHDVPVPPLDLKFKGDSIARKTFLCAVLMWAEPKVMSLMTKKSLRLRCFTGLNLVSTA